MIIEVVVVLSIVLSNAHSGGSFSASNSLSKAPFPFPIQQCSDRQQKNVFKQQANTRACESINFIAEHVVPHKFNCSRRCCRRKQIYAIIKMFKFEFSPETRLCELSWNTPRVVEAGVARSWKKTLIPP